jgi:Mn2+/Fe2+ NRAMP family transporter
VLIGLVGLMSLVFIVTAIQVGPDLPRLLAALVRPRVPERGGMLVLATVGTTVVPLYLAAVQVLGVGEMARQLEPLLGPQARWLFGLGLFAVTRRRPLEAILLAQAANGVLLPIIAGFLLWVINRAEVMGAARNGWRANLAGGAVVLLAAALGFGTIYRLFQVPVLRFRRVSAMTSRPAAQ